MNNSFERTVKAVLKGDETKTWPRTAGTESEAYKRKVSRHVYFFSSPVLGDSKRDHLTEHQLKTFNQNFPQKTNSWLWTNYSIKWVSTAYHCIQEYNIFKKWTVTKSVLEALMSKEHERLALKHLQYAHYMSWEEQAKQSSYKGWNKAKALNLWRWLLFQDHLEKSKQLQTYVF